MDGSGSVANALASAQVAQQVHIFALRKSVDRAAQQALALLQLLPNGAPGVGQTVDARA